MRKVTHHFGLLPILRIKSAIGSPAALPCPALGDGRGWKGKRRKEKRKEKREEKRRERQLERSVVVVVVMVGAGAARPKAG